MLWWLKMSNPSARNSRPNRSVTRNFFPAAMSAFHALGPRKELRRVMLVGNGPKSEMPSVGSSGAELAGIGTVSAVNWFGPVACGVPTWDWVIGVSGVKRGSVAKLYSLLRSYTEKGVP